MRWKCAALAGLTVLSLLLASCGSGDSPPLAVRCTVQKLAGRSIQARVTVSNKTDNPERAFLYGPRFTLLLRQMYPVVSAAPVTVALPNTSQTFLGLTIPHIPPHKTHRLFLQFAPAMQPHAIVVSDTAKIHASDWHVLDNPACTIRPS